MFEKARKIELFIIIAVIGVLGVIYAMSQKSTDNSDQQGSIQQNTNTDTSSQQQVPASNVAYRGEDGRTALDLLKVYNRVETKTTSFGEMVTGINGMEVDESKQFWAFYVNGSLASEGAATYKTKSTDTIEWKIESF